MGNSFVAASREWFRNASRYRRLGLLRDDLYDDQYNKFVREAIKRLPENQLQMRQYRIIRALDLTMKHALLPRDQWTKPEEDVQYLTPIIQQVKREVLERKAWERK